MKVNELKKILEKYNDESDIQICNLKFKESPIISIFSLSNTNINSKENTLFIVTDN